MSSELWSFDNQAITKALQMSLSNGNDSSSPSSSSVVEPPPAAAASAGRARDKMGLGTPAGKIAKRKSRVRKRTPSTYIEVDPQNFRAMVQQMTGAGVGVGFAEPAIKPEPRRQSFLPRTLDTSHFLLGPAENNAGSVRGGPVDEEELLGFDVDAFLSFPTLDPWEF